MSRIPHNYYLLISALCVAALLSACQRPVVGPQQERLAPLDVPPRATVFTVVPAESQVLILVYRAGKLAALGHNHTVSSQAVAGEIYLTEANLKASVMELRLPVASLQVDDAESRAQAGEGFDAAVDADAIAGTEANMLGERQLDAQAWPQIVLRSRGLSGSLPTLELMLDIAVRSSVHSLTVPVDVQIEDGRLTASGAFSVLQSDLGIEPFSIMMGAVAVRNQLDIRFRLAARSGGPE